MEGQIPPHMWLFRILANLAVWVAQLQVWQGLLAPADGTEVNDTLSSSVKVENKTEIYS